MNVFLPSFYLVLLKWIPFFTILTEFCRFYRICLGRTEFPTIASKICWTFQSFCTWTCFYRVFYRVCTGLGRYFWLIFWLFRSAGRTCTVCWAKSRWRRARCSSWWPESGWAARWRRRRWASATARRRRPASLCVGPWPASRWGSSFVFVFCCYFLCFFFLNTIDLSFRRVLPFLFHFSIINGLIVFFRVFIDVFIFY